MTLQRNYKESQTVRLNSDVTLKADDDSVVIFSPQSGRYWAGNATASSLLVMIEAHASIASLIDDFSEFHGIGKEQAREDIVALLCELEKARAIEVRNGAE